VLIGIYIADALLIYSTGFSYDDIHSFACFLCESHFAGFTK